MRLSSAGQTASLVLDQVRRKDSGHGHAKGHFAATVCRANGMPVKVDTRYCKPISGTFEMDLQYDTE